MNWTHEQLQAHIQRRAQAAKSQRAVCHEPLAAQQGEARHAARYVVSVHSRRIRLIDPDNLCPKYFIDGLRYAGLIPGDAAKDIEVKVTQEKSTTEETVITIERL
jgi:hypothetical protein